PYRGNTRVEQTGNPDQGKADGEDKPWINLAHQRHRCDAKHKLRKSYPEQDWSLLQWKKSSDGAEKSWNANNCRKHHKAKADYDECQQQCVPPHEESKVDKRIGQEKVADNRGS